MEKKPVIGITADFETAQTYSNYPWYALRENYVTAISKAGGVPIILPHDTESMEHYYNLIDGLVITGGNFDIDPKHYGEEISSDLVCTKGNRTLFELELCLKAFNNNTPILGICGGEQLLNVVLGGTLIQHIGDSVPTDIDHEQKILKHLPSHSVKLSNGSLLHKIIGKEVIEVNSTHHQAVKTLGNKLIITGKAEDGIIEAIEAPNRKFCIGVQWHPEYCSQEYDIELFKALVAACG